MYHTRPHPPSGTGAKSNQEPGFEKDNVQNPFQHFLPANTPQEWEEMGGNGRGFKISSYSGIRPVNSITSPINAPRRNMALEISILSLRPWAEHFRIRF